MDSSGNDESSIENIVRVLHKDLKYANQILLLMDGRDHRFLGQYIHMLRMMSTIFGNKWWDFMMIGVSKWSFKPSSIEEREENCIEEPDYCKDENWYQREFQGHLENNFQLNRTFDFVFIDSFSQSKKSKHDNHQQKRFMEETTKLWNAATSSNKKLEFLTVDQVYQRLAEFKARGKVVQS